MHAERNLHRTYLVILAVVAMLAVVFAVSWLVAHPGALLTLTPTAGVLTASMWVPVEARDAKNLALATLPTRTQVVRAPWYDQQAYTSGATTQMNFFGAINNDKTLSNSRGNGGALPANTYFEPLWVNVDFVAQPTIGVGAITGMLDDINKLLYVGRGALSITLGQTTFPQIPISYCHTSGGAVGTIAATYTAPVSAQFGNNGTQDSGYCIGGSFIVSPNTNFSCQINFGAAQTLLSTVPQIRLSFDGNWYLPTVG